MDLSFDQMQTPWANNFMQSFQSPFGGAGMYDPAQAFLADMFGGGGMFGYQPGGGGGLYDPALAFLEETFGVPEWQSGQQQQNDPWAWLYQPSFQSGSGPGGSIRPDYR